MIFIKNNNLRNFCLFCSITLFISNGCKKSENTSQSVDRFAFSELVWAEEFGNENIDTAVWKFESGPYWNLGEIQKFSPNNGYIKDGNLLLEARYSSNKYTSACLKTVEKLDLRNKKLVIRAKLPYGKGLLSSFTLRNATPQPAIDIASVTGNDITTIYSTVRVPDSGKDEYQDYQKVPDLIAFGNEYHTFTILNDEGDYYWYLDDSLYYKVSEKYLIDHSADFNQPFHLFLHLSVGGLWASDVHSVETHFPSSIKIDYIRLYSKPLEKVIKKDNKKNFLPILADKKDLIWHDEFEGEVIDTLKWTFEAGDVWSNNELQSYTNKPENIRTENGNLIVSACKNYDSKFERNYTSARLITRNKGDWNNCRIDVRVKLPAFAGGWPAVWMLPTENRFGEWPKSGEIDILEYLGNEKKSIHFTAHFGENSHHARGRKVTFDFNLDKDYHIFSLVKRNNELSWYMDDQLVHWINRDEINPHFYPFNEKFYLLINLAVGGWAGYPDKTVDFPQNMMIDYVRVFSLK